MIAYIFAAALFRAIDSFIDKNLTPKGISRFDYFFYMCISMLPFAFIMMVFEPIKFVFHWAPVILLLVSALLRYLQQHAVVGIIRKVEPYQYQTYLTMGIILTYIIDCFLGTRTLTFENIISIFLVLGGVICIGDLKFRFSNLHWDILIRVFGGLLQGYITFYILKYWSNAFYIFSLNLILTVPFLKRYCAEQHPLNRGEIIRMVFIQQCFGFISVYLTNTIMAKSVTLGIYVVPTAIIIAFLMSFFKNYTTQRIDIKQGLAVIMVTIGILLL